MNYDLISVIIQSAETIIISIALIYTWQQIKAMRHDIHLGAMWEIFRELDNDELRASRYFIYKNRSLYQMLESSDAKLATLPPEAWKHAQKVSTNLDHLGYMVSRNLIPKILIWDGYRYVIARSWMVLEPFVKAVRKKRKQGSYQSYFEHLAVQILKQDIKGEQIVLEDEPDCFQVAETKLANVRPARHLTQRLARRSKPER